MGTFFTETGSVSSSGTFLVTLLAGKRVVFSIEPRDVSPWSGVFPVLEAVLSPYDWLAGESAGSESQKPAY